jgi:hypothetical protein
VVTLTAVRTLQLAGAKVARELTVCYPSQVLGVFTISTVKMINIPVTLAQLGERTTEVLTSLSCGRLFDPGR